MRDSFEGPFCALFRLAGFLLPGVLAASVVAADLRDTTHTDLQLGRARDVLAVDLDGDGDEDLVVARVDDAGSPLAIFLQNRGVFSDATSGALPPALPGPGSFATAGDFEKDEDPDVVYCPSGPQDCIVLANQHSQTGRVEFADLTAGAGITAGPGPWLPLLVDYDADGDEDLLLFPGAPGRLGRVVRNDSRDGQYRFSTLPEGSLPLTGPVRDVGVIDAEGKGKLLYVSRVGPDRVLQQSGAAFADASDRYGLPRTFTPPGTVAVGDFDGDGTRDVVVHRGQSGAVMLVQDASGALRDVTGMVTGLSGPRTLLPHLIAEDFDRDGRDDVFVSGSFQSPAELLLNGGSGGGLVARFADATTLAGIQPVDFPTAAATYLRPQACDWGVGLVLGSGLGTTGSPSRLHGFPDDSARHTFPVDTSGFARAAEAFGCAEGAEGPDQLVGHRVASILRGGDGRDELIATAGVTLMEGGPGPDRFDTAGLTIIRMDAADIAPGEFVDCQRADEVRIDTKLSLDELVAAGVGFYGCFEEGDCEDEPDHHEEDEESSFEENENEAHCHPPPPVLTVANYGFAPGVGGVQDGLDLGFAPSYGSGYGSCEIDADCYAIGLDFCRTATGSPPSPGGTGQCYPSTDDGFGGPVSEWCRDPFWARYRYDELQEEFEANTSAIVVPIVFWLPRSNAVLDDGTCTIPDQAGPGLSVAEWYESIAVAVNGSNGLFGKWGVYLDWQLRTFTVSTSSPFVADPDTDACQVELDFDDDAPNSVGDLVDSRPFAYRSCELNIYLSDNGGGGVASKNKINNDTESISFIILKSSAGALSHEVGHKLGLPHPYSNNIFASSQEPEKSESRDSWAARPFPDEVDRLHVCSSNADCTGLDADPGVCLKAPFTTLGYCQNLKADCAYDGDHICDTPWDSLPCFQGVSSNEGNACNTNDDCHATSTFRGTSYLTECGPGDLCRKIQCQDNGDCDADSYCADGSCVITKSSSTACCDMHTDRTLGFSHSACWELQGNAVVPVPGQGDFTIWPYDDNVMAYHKPRGRFRSLTPGQRDYSVCRTSYRSDWGEIIRGQLGDGEPCSTRSGDGIYSHTDANVTMKVSHGACASGVCQVTDTGVTTAVCVPSTCSDGLIGPDEAATDCGGVCGVPCATNLSSSPKTAFCREDSDCVSARCHFGVCQPTCEDGQDNAAELGVDTGGQSWDATCGVQSEGDLCRWDAECGGPTTCAGEQFCVTSGECPINDDPLPCLTNSECPSGGGKCKILKGLCETSGCFIDAECPDSFCQLPEGRCACTASDVCPNADDTCQPSQTMCTGQCIDGRCLGRCEPQIGLP